MASPSEFVDALRSRRPEWLAALETLVRHETPSRDKPALDRLADLLAERFRAIGGVVTVEPHATAGNHLRIRFFDDRTGGPPALVLAHYDTVWPVGTLATMPWRVEGDHAYGPGVFDMKASLVQAEFALRAIRDHGHVPPRPVELLITSDEEVGSTTSRALIEARARKAAFVLVLEPPLADGSFKTARKGVGAFTIRIEGRAAHAGVEPEKGVSAITELAHQILAVNALADPAAGTTVNVGVVAGGTTTNVVPAQATARVDVRAVTAAEAKRIEAAFASLAPVQPGITLDVTGGFNRPPMERTPAVADLCERAQRLANTLGLRPGEGSTGGGSDGNFAAALGVATLDGLGIEGAGAHATHEQIRIDSVIDRAALLAVLLLNL